MRQFWLQDFRSRLVKLMVVANDDPQTPAFKEIEQLVEAQVQISGTSQIPEAVLGL